MLIVQIVLIAVIVAALIYFLTHDDSKAAAYKKMAAIVVTIFAILAIAQPTLTDKIAAIFGIERGSYLLLYVVTIIVWFEVIANRLQRGKEEKYFAKLVRKVAILEAKIEDLEKTKDE
ncbi:MAG: DUF2304 domain-containing protein [Streptococcaceae bacterium]|jgi:hypothetical protein|nr:DUF2304 domain-containing protein [Streptococcaceae bacterium]